MPSVSLSFNPPMPNLLFICTANICRSPMALGLFEAKLARLHLSGWQVDSAGTWTQAGFPAASYGVELLAEKGIDISAHRSKEVDRDLLAAADLVLTMERGHKEALHAEFPEYAGRVYMLSEMVGEQFDVADPIGGARLAFRDTIEELAHYLDAGFERIRLLAGPF